MARDISTITQTNLWGKQADQGLGLEPQRNDLYFVDFAPVVKNVAAATTLQLAPIKPQYVRSVTLPELRTKPDTIRRDSVPYNTPSWDDPLDPIKLVFLMDTNNGDDESAVIRFLDAWLVLTRAGRGSRNAGYLGMGWLELNSDYRVDFQFDLNVYLLRGADINVGGFFNSTDGRSDDEFRRVMATANAVYRNRKKALGQIQQGDTLNLEPQAANYARASILPESGGGAFKAAVFEQDMVIHTTLLMKGAWLGAYKVSDLSYTESALVTVECTLYADAVELPDSTGALPDAAQKVSE